MRSYGTYAAANERFVRAWPHRMLAGQPAAGHAALLRGGITKRFQPDTSIGKTPAFPAIQTPVGSAVPRRAWCRASRARPHAKPCVRLFVIISGPLPLPAGLPST